MADAGEDRAARVGDTVELDGSGSHVVGLPPETRPDTAQWTIINAPEGSVGEAEASIDNPTALETIMHVEVAGLYVVRLDVSHDGVGGEPAYVNVHVMELEPVELIVTAPSVTVEYGEEAPALEPIYEGFVDGQGPGDLLEEPTCSTPYSAGDTVGTYVTTCEGGADGRYFFTFVDGTLEVEAAMLTVNAPSPTITYGEDRPHLEPIYEGLAAGDTPQDLDSEATCSVEYTAGQPVGTYLTECSGASSTNYIVQHVDGQLTVEHKDLAITALDAEKTYGDVVDLTGDEFEAEGLVLGDEVEQVALSSTGAPAEAEAGEHPISIGNAEGSGLSNYDIEYIEGVLLVEQAPLMITADDRHKTYGEEVTFGGTEFEAFGLRNEDTVDLVTLSSLGAQATAHVGEYEIVPEDAQGTGLDNYSIDYLPGTLSVSPSDLVITSYDQAKTYGEQLDLQGTEFDVAGLAAGDTVTSATLYSDGFAADAWADEYPIVPSDAQGTNLENYSIEYVSGELTVSRADLVITAQDTSKTYGEELELTMDDVVIDGLLLSDTVDDLSVSSEGAPATGTAGPHPIIVGDAQGPRLDNYDIEYEHATLQVDPAPLTITAEDQLKVYGEDFQFDGNEFTAQGLVNEDTIDEVSLTSEGTDPTAEIGEYLIEISDATGTGLENYDITYEPGTFTIAHQFLTITALDASKTYGEELSFDGTEFEHDGLEPGDTITEVTLSSTGAAAAAGAGSYVIEISDAQGDGLENYHIVYEEGTLTVNPAPLTITPDDQGKVYGEGFTFGGTEFTSDGLLFTDSVSSVELYSDATEPDADVGTYDITASDATGSGIDNYDITYETGTFTVGAATLTVSAVDQSKIYGEEFSFQGTELETDGLLFDDSVTSATIQSDGAPATADVGSYDIVIDNATGDGLHNYDITYVEGTLDVTHAALTVRALDQSKTYGTLFEFDGTEIETEGLANDDEVQSASLSSPGAAEDADVGTYDIFVSGASGAGLDNYIITYEGGELVVQPAELTITADDQSKVYGEELTFTDTEFETEGLLLTDTVDAVSLSSDGAPEDAPAGTYPVHAEDAQGSGLGNYDITYEPGTLTVEGAPLTVTLHDQSKIYGETFEFDGTEFNVEGLLFDDSLDSLDISSPGAPAEADVGQHAITGENPQGDGIDNYDITYVDGELTVEQAQLTITPDDQTKVYGAELTFDGTEFATDGLLNEDEVTWVSLSSDGAAAEADMGEYDILAEDAAGDGLDNYEITYEIGTLTVEIGEPASIVISPDESTIEAGETETYTAVAYNEYGNEIGDVTGSTTWSIQAGAGGSWANNVYTSEVAGTWTVTGEYTAGGDTFTDNATLNVNVGDAFSIVVSPPDSTMTAGETETYTAVAYDEHDNEIGDVTDLTDWSIEEEAGGSWAGNVYTSEVAGHWTVQGDYEGLQDIVSLTVDAASEEYLVISPDESTIEAGETETYTAVVFDEYDNEIGEVTDFTDWSIEGEAGGSWIDNVYTSEVAGTWTVTGEYTVGGDTFTDTATLTVNVGAADTLALLAYPSGQIPAGEPFDAEVRVEDSHGNVIETAAGSVAIEIGEGPAEAELSDDTAAPLENGVAEFSDLYIETAGEGYTLVLTWSGLEAETPPFDIEPGSLCVMETTVTASPTEIAADGVSTSTITVQAKDELGNELTSGGGTVCLTTTAGTLSGDQSGCADGEVEAQDNDDGTYTSILTSSEDPSEQAVISGRATVDDVLTDLVDETTVDFVVIGEPVQDTGGSSGNIATAVFSAQPTEGNLLVAVSVHRMDWTKAFISGEGWNQAVLMSEAGGARKGMAVWWKVAGENEPDTVQSWWQYDDETTDAGRHNALVVQEYRGTFTLDVQAENSSGGDTVSTISTNTTPVSSTADSLIVGTLGHRDEADVASWTNDLSSDVHFVSTEAPYDITVQAAHRTALLQQAWDSQATFAPARHTLASILVFSHVPEQMEMAWGDDQVGVVNEPLDEELAVRVSDPRGFPVAGHEVTFSIRSEPGETSEGSTSLTVTNATTDSKGIAATSLTLGDATGEYVVRAEAPDLVGSPVDFTATAEEPPAVPTEVVVTQHPPASLTVGSAFSVQAEILDEDGEVYTDYDGDIEIAVHSIHVTNPSLIGETSMTPTNGVVDFSNLAIDSPATQVVLRLVDSGEELDPGFTDPVDVDAFEGGSGGTNDPYEISNVYQLQAMKDHLDAHYVLVDHIDASDTIDWHGGEGFIPIGDDGGSVDDPFLGTFDGQGYTITGLHIDRDGQKGYGLFGHLDGDATVENVCLYDVNITGTEEVGAIVGHVDDAGVVVRNVCSTGFVAGTNRRIGGLIGNLKDGLLENAWTRAEVHGGNEIGGAVGRSDDGVIWFTYSAGLVVSNEGNVGGLIGNGVGAESSFWDIEASGLATSSDGTGKTSEEMKDVRTYTDTTYSAGLGTPWDFVDDPFEDEGEDDIWNLDSDRDINDGYPVLETIEGLGTGAFTLVTLQMRNPDGQGAVVPAPGEHLHTQNVILNVHALPDAGFKLDHWDGDVANSDWLDTTITLDTTKMLGAVFTDLFAGGQGNQAQPYQVEDIQDLQAMRENLGAHYRLVSQIDASQTALWNDGEGFEPVGVDGSPFTGGLDGDGHLVIGLFMDRPGEAEVGLFGLIANEAGVRNVCLKQVTVIGYEEVGAIAGRTDTDTLIEQVCSTGQVFAMNEVAGGLVGRNRNDGVIRNSYSRASVSAGNEQVGGLVGRNHGDGVIEFCHSTGPVSDVTDSGGLVGRQSSGGVVFDSYWDTETSGQGGSAGGTGLTTNEMKDQNSFPGWDFTDIWDIDPNGFIAGGYPHLRIFF